MITYSTFNHLIKTGELGLLITLKDLIQVICIYSRLLIGSAPLAINF